MLQLEIENFNLKDILTCGQCFRWQAVSDMDWIGVAGGRVLRVIQVGTSVSFNCSQEDFDSFWRNYFDLDRDYGQIKAELLERSPDLAEAIAYGAGVRLLNQEPFEMLITYILSANNHIPRITELVRKISEAYGTPIAHPWEHLVGTLYAFPRPEKLATVTAEAFRALGTGYRDQYLCDSANKASEEWNQLSQMAQMPYLEAKNMLMAYSGVGPKVADCILLFSAGKHEAFPIDTWIKKTLARRYQLPENKTKLISEFIDNRFGPLKGFANQYLFYYERSLTSAEKEF